ncbi:hypothetical protein Tco_0760125 [Tanacetum coccineum]
MSTSKTYQQSLADAGSENRPPMLERGSYIPWASRFRRYLNRKRDNRKWLLKALDEGPYVFKNFIPEGSTIPRLQTAEDLEGDDLLLHDAEMEVMNMILLSIPNEIYNSVDACTSAKDMWKRVERLMRGTIQNKVDRETRFTNEFDQFVAEPGEALVSVYNRFAQLMNDLERNNMNFPTVTINTKFLNSLQPEWLKYVTQVRLAKQLTVDSFDDLFDYLQQFEKLVNASRAKKLEKSHDPLALVAHTGSSSRQTSSYYVTHPTSVVDYDDEYQQDDVHNNSEDPLVSAMLLLAKAITQNFSNPTNNRLRASSNTRNQAIIQGDRGGLGGGTRNSGNTGRNIRRAYVQEEVVEGMNAPKETGNVQRTLRTPSSGNTSTDEAGVILTDEQNDFLFADASRMEEIKKLSANICLMARIQPTDHTSDDGPSYESTFISEVQSLSIDENNEPMYLTHTKIISSTIGDDQINSNIKFDSFKGNVNSGSVEIDTHVPDLCAVEKLARNAYQEAEKQRILTDERAKRYNKQAQSQLVRDRDIIRDLEKQRDKLDLDVKNYKRKNEELQKTHSILKRQMSEKEDTYHDTILDLEAKLKKNVDLILKLGNSLQGMFMLGPKPLSVYDQQLKHGLGYPNPYTLKQAILKCLKLYVASSLGNLEISLNVGDSENTFEDAFKSQQKMTEKMNDPIAVANKQNCWTINYKKLNALYKDFVPQKELSVEQKYFPSSSIPSVKISNLFQRDIKEMKDVFESTESEIDELEKQNNLLKDQLLEASLKQDMEKLEDENVSLDFKVQSLIKERDNAKMEYKKLFDSIKKTRSQNKKEMDELIVHVSEKTYAYGAIRAENQNLLSTISELKTRLKKVEKGMNATSRVRRPMSRDSHVAHSVLDNSKKAAKNVGVYVRKNKQTCVIPNKENVIDVDVANASKAKTLLCASCMKNVLISCHDKCVAKHKLNMCSNVRRTFSTNSRQPKSLETTFVAPKTRFSKKKTQSKTLDTTFVVSKSKIDVESASKAKDKVSSASRIKKRSRIWKKWFESQPNVIWNPVSVKLNVHNTRSYKKPLVSVKKWVVVRQIVYMRINDKKIPEEIFPGRSSDRFSHHRPMADDIQGNITICHVYYVEGDDLLTGGRDSNLYTISNSDMAASSPVCLMSKATSTKSWLWNRRLSHLNFGTIKPDLTWLTVYQSSNMERITFVMLVKGEKARKLLIHLNWFQVITPNWNDFIWIYAAQ